MVSKISSENRKILNIIFHLVLIFELAVFQVFWPLAIAKAEMQAADTSAQEENTADKDKEGTKQQTKNAEETNGAESSEKEPEKQENPESFWKSCNLSEEETDLIKKAKCEECRKKTDCRKIKVCLSAFLDIANETRLKNEVESNSSTGGNEIKIDEDSSIQDESNTQTELENQEISSNKENTAGLLLESSANENQNDVSPTRSTEENQTSNSPESESNQENSSSSNLNNNVSEEEITANENSSIQKETSSAEIETGDAVAQANVYNEVNTNVVGENTEKMMENIEGVVTSDINLLKIFDSLLDNASKSDGKGTLVDINIKNTATVENSVTANAETGKNSIAGEGDEAFISTGDAIAAANIVNIVNLNLIGNNWLFATINIFGEWIGNLIVPGKGLLSVPSWSGIENVLVTTENNATVENSATANAETGGNSIKGKNANASIETGSAYSRSNILNVVNTTIIKNNWFFLAINNMGSWVGKAVHWDGGANQESYSYDFGESESWGRNVANWFVNIFVKNSATVENSATANAETGGNSIEGNFENASVATGNASARANIWNFVNTNIIGSNWFFATVNIFGNWKGNVDFAYPDLAISLSDGKERVKNGDEIDYSVIYKNSGHADCDGVDLRVALPQYFDFQGDSSGVSPDIDGNNFTWHLPGLKAGETKSFSIKGIVSDSLPEGELALSALAVVKTTTKEVEMENNTSSDETIFYRLVSAAGNISLSSENSGGSSEDGQINSVLSISRKIKNGKAKPGEIVKHTIVVENTGEEMLTDVVVQDTLKNKKGRIGTYQWEIGNLGKNQKAIVTYSLRINPGAPSGDYKGRASAFGNDSKKNRVKSPEASVTFRVEIPESGLGEYYYKYYQNYPPVQYLKDGSGLVSTAEAAELGGNIPQGKTLGAWTNGVCHKLPWWGWLAAGVVYLTTIHWSLLRQKQVVELVKK